MQELKESDVDGSGLAWMLITQQLTKPWPKEAAWADLHLFDWFETFTTHKAPGRVVLAERWGWSGSRTTALLRHFKETDEPVKHGQRDSKRIRRAYNDLYRLLK